MKKTGIPLDRTLGVEAFKIFEKRKIISGRFIGACNYWDEAVWQCTKQERILRRSTNPGYKRRIVENRRLPEEMYTTPLRQLKEQGLLNIDDTNSGCKI